MAVLYELGAVSGEGGDRGCKLCRGPVIRVGDVRGKAGTDANLCFNCIGALLDFAHWSM